jgi:hypothetical protein
MSNSMKPHYSLFSQVALAEDLTEHHLQITVEVAASQIMPIGEWQRRLIYAYQRGSHDATTNA